MHLFFCVTDHRSRLHLVSSIIETLLFVALLFTFAGLAQMTIWALGKHKNYKNEFKDYPRGRKAIIPFVI